MQEQLLSSQVACRVNRIRSIGSARPGLTTFLRGAWFILGGCVTLAGPPAVVAEPILEGDVLVMGGSTMAVYTTAGRIRQQIEVPYGDGIRPLSEDAQDLIVGSDCRVAVYNGTNRPFLSLFDRIEATWVHHRFPIDNIVKRYPGSIVAYENQFFMNVSTTVKNDHGLLRFHLDSESFDRRLGEYEFIDLAQQQGGLLYGLVSPTRVIAFDPDTFGRRREIDLFQGETSAIAVGRSGNVFAGGGDTLREFDRTGRQVSSFNFRLGAVRDVDVSTQDRFLIGLTFGQIFIQRDPEHSRIVAVGPTTPFGAFAETIGESCRFPSRPPRLVARLDFPEEATVGDPFAVGVRFTRQGDPVADERLPFGLRVIGPATIVDATTGTLIEGKNSQRGLLETENGLADVVVAATATGEVRFELDDPEQRGYVFVRDVREDFEEDDGDFHHAGLLDTWSWGRVGFGGLTAHSGRNAWATRRVAEFAIDTAGFVETPVYELPASGSDVELRFWHSFGIPPGRRSTAWVFASANGGPMEPILPGYENPTGGWVEQRVPLRDLAAGGSIQFLFEFRGDAFANGAYWLIDDLALEGLERSVSVSRGIELFHRGDANDDGRLDVSDALKIVGALFLGRDAPACNEAADVNNDGAITLVDAVRLLGFLFLGAAEIPPPGPVTSPCGEDTDRKDSAGALGCNDYDAC